MPPVPVSTTGGRDCHTLAAQRVGAMMENRRGAPPERDKMRMSTETVIGIIVALQLIGLTIIAFRIMRRR
jgi:hypothetical protein